MHSIFLVSSNASKPNLSLYSYGNSGFFIQQNKFIVIYNASVIAFQEKIPSIFKGCYCCYKSKKYRRRRPTQKYTILSILLLAATTGLVPVLLLRCCPRRSSPSLYLKVPILVPRGRAPFGKLTKRSAPSGDKLFRLPLHNVRTHTAWPSSCLPVDASTRWLRILQRNLLHPALTKTFRGTSMQSLKYKYLQIQNLLDILTSLFKKTTRKGE